MCFIDRDKMGCHFQFKLQHLKKKRVFESEQENNTLRRGVLELLTWSGFLGSDSTGAFVCIHNTQSLPNSWYKRRSDFYQNGEKLGGISE